MASGAPYNMDFLRRITNVHFGADYFCIGVDVPQHHFVPTVDSIKVSFPNIAGGTPGFSLFPSAVPGYPHHVTAADLQQHLRTGAGSSQIGGFGLQGITGVNWDNPPNFAFQGYLAGWELYVALGNTPIACTLDVTGHETLGSNGISEGWAANVNVRVIKKGAVKVGLALPAPPKADTAGAVCTFQNPPTGQAPSSSFELKFLVNPSTRTASVVSGSVSSSDKVAAATYFYNGNAITPL